MPENFPDKLKVLLLEDNPADVEFVQRELRKGGIDYEMVVADKEDEFVEGLKKLDPDIVLSDHALPQFNSMEAYRLAKKFKPSVSFMLVTGTVSEEFAVECMKAGVDDYILKSSLTRLVPSVKNILSKKKILEEKNVIEELNLQLAKKNKDLTDSITYARRIQEAMLPNAAMFKRNFPESFLIYRPKHIVSGDFYWCSERDGRSIVAVADCTGHGVPGAFMSIIGYTLLDSIINKEGVVQPGKILGRLNTMLRKALKQDEETSLTRDGMDVAICAIDKKNNVFEYAGANRPLCFLRKAKLEVVKGTPMGIGGVLSKAGAEYTQHRFKLNSLSHIYMFSDGYSDQFGGDKDKKMMTRNFFKVLGYFASFPMEEQRSALNDWLDDWKGNFEQTDDILIAGIKV